jgi:hypothetical protein
VEGTCEGGEKLPKTLASSGGSFYMPLLERSFIRDLYLLCLEGAREVGGDVEKVRS